MYYNVSELLQKRGNGAVWNDGIMERWNVGLKRHKSKTGEYRFPILPLIQPIIPLFHHSSIPIAEFLR